MKGQLSPDQNIVYVIGALTLCYQDIERAFKLFIPFLNSDDPEWTSVFARGKAISKETLGGLSGQFVKAASGDTEELRKFMTDLVSRRNALVHHFPESYGDMIRAGRHEAALSKLRQQHQDALHLRRALFEVCVGLFEGIRDTTFRGTAEYDEMAALCLQARRSLAAGDDLESAPQISPSVLVEGGAQEGTFTSIHAGPARPIHRGDIYWLASEGTQGSVPPIRHPHVVVQDDLFNHSRIDTVVVCGITSNARRVSEPGTVRLSAGEGGLERESVVLASQVSSVPKDQLGEHIGTLSEARVEQVLSALRFLQLSFHSRPDLE